MRWLLITTLGKNPGDEFIRIGVQNIIREIDPLPTFQLIDKEDRTTWKKRPFDRAIWCGMPLFWSNAQSAPHRIDWWEGLLMDWVSADPRKFLIYGAGTFFTQHVYDASRLRATVRDAIPKTWRLVMRDPALEQFGFDLPVMPCPAIFALLGLPKGDPKQVKLCNLMPHGAHYRALWPEQAAAWEIFIDRNKDLLIDSGYEAVAHNQAEADFAHHLGFPTVHHLTTPEQGLRLYQWTRAYFGNRLHGGILSRAAWAPTLVCGYDTRLGMVQLCGAETTTPLELTREQLAVWTHHPKLGPIPPIMKWIKQAKQLLLDFAAPILTPPHH